MKILVDYMPKNDYQCPFFKVLNNGNIIYLCKIDNKPCTLETTLIQTNSCRWLREYKRE